MLVRNYELRLQMPKCSPFAEKGSGVASLDEDIGEVLPYLNAVLPAARYLPNAPAIVFDDDGHHVAVWPREVLVGGCAGEDEAREVLDRVCALINDTWDRREEIEPDHQGFEEMTALEAFRLLPGTNCKECGEAACLPFAMKLVARQADIEACLPLFLPECEGKRRALLAELSAHGYCVPPDGP
jgi:ArsR family metal-binding transcriptional regulator